MDDAFGSPSNFDLNEVNRDQWSIRNERPYTSTSGDAREGLVAHVWCWRPTASCGVRGDS
ncbi:hypothetical protein PVK06_041408 [Gossypium arboreum]|uniref:Uncharacterized protein n=1 Tax=Gossypium arboreum TaxID=29729 RepID=A0ABR0NAY4_GOSAR|nr:hypothetical protein PVK06_041408 [Gossypium arboreum]